MSFGRQPIANGFLSASEFADEYFFEMEVAICEACATFQLINQPDPERMFHSNYAFFSSLSKHMQQHFKKWADSVTETFLRPVKDPLVIEIGSNDGIMLRNFKKAKIRHLGIEPSENVAQIALDQGINTVCCFFNEQTASEIIKSHGKADVVLAANVMCHIPNIQNVAQGISKLLKEDGVLMFEDPYLGDMLNKTSYDQIYDEHVFIFSAISVSEIFKPHGLELINVEPQITHGGSMRYTFGRIGRHKVHPSVRNIIQKEKFSKFDQRSTFDSFKINCEKSKSDLTALLQSLTSKGKKIVGYAATSKSSTVMNYCDINSDLIAYISDTTPIKIGKFSPGCHIPIVSHDEFSNSYPDYALLLAWNHATEIFEKERSFYASGGRWISFVPKVEILK